MGHFCKKKFFLPTRKVKILVKTCKKYWGTPLFFTQNFFLKASLNCCNLGYDGCYGYGHIGGPSSGYMRGLEEEEVLDNVKEEETGIHSRSFAIFDSPSKLRFAPKSPQFYDKHVSLTQKSRLLKSMKTQMEN